MNLNLLKEKLTKIGLSNIGFLVSSTVNCVGTAFYGDKPIVFKTTENSKDLQREIQALRAFQGYGAVQLIYSTHDLYLMEHIKPGASLKTYFPEQEEASYPIVVDLIETLHRAPISGKYGFPHIRQWLGIFDNIEGIPNEICQKACTVRDYLLRTSEPDVLLHGDLHHDNILKKENYWVAIDPHGVRGESLYDICAFIRNPIPELLSHQSPDKIINQRIHVFSKMLNKPAGRILDWCFVQAVLAWAWALEDGVNPNYFEQLTGLFGSIKLQV